MQQIKLSDAKSGLQRHSILFNCTAKNSEKTWLDLPLSCATSSRRHSADDYEKVNQGTDLQEEEEGQVRKEDHIERQRQLESEIEDMPTLRSFNTRPDYATSQNQKQ